MARLRLSAPVLGALGTSRSDQAVADSQLAHVATILRDVRRSRSGMDPGLVPLIFVDDLESLDAVEPVVCPLCWNVTAVWLASPSGRATCEVCENRFEVAPQVA